MDTEEKVEESHQQVMDIDYKDMLVDAICGCSVPMWEQGFCQDASKDKIISFTGDQWNPHYSWVKSELYNKDILFLHSLYRYVKDLERIRLEKWKV